MPALGMLLSHFLWPGPLKVPQNATDICCLCSFAWQPQCQLKHQRKLPWALSFLFLRTEKTRWNLSWSCWWPCASSGPFTASHPTTWRMDEVLRPLKMSSGYSCPQSGPSSNPPSNTESLQWPFSCWIPLDSISPYFSIGTADWRTAWTITLPFVQGQEQPEQQIVLTVERKEMEGNWRLEVPDLYRFVSLAANASAATYLFDSVNQTRCAGKPNRCPTCPKKPQQAAIAVELAERSEVHCVQCCVGRSCTIFCRALY